MRILFVLEYYPPHMGGVEVLFETLARGLVEQGHEVRVLTTRLPGYAVREQRHGVQVERLSVPFDSRSLFSIWTIPAAVRAARWADVIHTTTYNAIPPASIAGILTGTPVLVTGHERLGKLWFSLPRVSKVAALALYMAEHVLYRFPAARIAAVSEASKRDIIEAGISPSRVTCIHNAMDAEPWQPDRLAERTEQLRERHDLSGKTIIVCYGRPGMTKGIEYAVRAFGGIRREFPNAMLVLIVGRSPADGYRRISRELDRIGRAHVLELNDLPFSELPAHVNLADVVVVPSLTEGFGYTTLEASTLDKRIVASRIGAIPEVISGRYLLVEPRNPGAIANAVVSIIRDPPPAEPTRTFDAKRMVERYLEEYERITQR